MMISDSGLLFWATLYNDHFVENFVLSVAVKEF